MKTILTRLSDDKAKKEIKQFTIAGVVLSLVSLVIFWWLAIAGLAFSARGLLLAFHKANANSPKLTLYKVLSVIGVISGLISLVYGLMA